MDKTKRKHKPKAHTAESIEKVKKYLEGRSDAASLPYQTIIDATGATRYAIEVTKRELGLMKDQLAETGDLSPEQLDTLRKEALAQRKKADDAIAAVNAVAKTHGLTDQKVINGLVAYVQENYSAVDMKVVRSRGLTMSWRSMGSLVEGAA